MEGCEAAEEAAAGGDAAEGAARGGGASEVVPGVETEEYDLQDLVWEERLLGGRGGEAIARSALWLERCVGLRSCLDPPHQPSQMTFFSKYSFFST